MLPRQYDIVELLREVINLGVPIPTGTKGTIVELHGNPTEAYMVEFDHESFGKSFLCDLSLSQFKIVERFEKA